MKQNQDTTQNEKGFSSTQLSEKSNLSMFVGIGAFTIILVGLVWYITQITQTNTTNQVNNIPVTQVSTHAIATNTEDVVVTSLTTQGDSDEVSEINADLKATDLNSLNSIDGI